MTEAKFRDIVETMIEYKLIDPVRAMIDREYLTERFWTYVEAANIARSMMHMEPIM
jgi:hypothetical protein